MTDIDFGFSMRETLAHKLRVADLLSEVANDIINRAVHHDDSKFSADEFDSFAKETPLLKSLTYGSDEYKAALDRIRPAITTHYARNRHHPEHHAGGINGMTLVDLIEMLCDWKAATERHADGSIYRSIDQNRERFKYGPEIEGLLRRTADALGYSPDNSEVAP